MNWFKWLARARSAQMVGRCNCRPTCEVLEVRSAPGNLVSLAPELAGPLVSEDLLSWATAGLLDQECSYTSVLDQSLEHSPRGPARPWDMSDATAPAGGVSYQPFTAPVVPLDAASGLGGGGAASTDSSSVFTPSTSPYGQTYGQWSAAWWQWTFRVPRPENPLLDETGELASVGQSGPVWYLTGNFGGTTMRTATVPSDKGLFFPILTSVFWNGPGEHFTTEELRAFAAQEIDGATNLSLEIDGATFRHLDRHRVQSPEFSFTLPPNNIINFRPGTYDPAVSDGYFVMLRPLPAGQHSIHFHGELPAFGFSLDVTYNLTVS